MKRTLLLAALAVVSLGALAPTPAKAYDDCDYRYRRYDRYDRYDRYRGDRYYGRDRDRTRVSFYYDSGGYFGGSLGYSSGDRYYRDRYYDRDRGYRRSYYNDRYCR